MRWRTADGIQTSADPIHNPSRLLDRLTPSDAVAATAVQDEEEQLDPNPELRSGTGGRGQCTRRRGGLVHRPPRPTGPL